MKKFQILLFIFFFLMTGVLSAEITRVEDNRIVGTWINNSIYYVFDNQGVMKVIQLDSKPVSYQAYQYEMLSMGTHNVIRYGKDLSDSVNVSFLLVREISDSSAVISYGVAFVRADSGEGLRGSWMHIGNLTSIVWNIDTDTIYYRQDILDPTIRRMVTVEERNGIYKRGTANEAGIFKISFDDGKEANVMPIFVKDILYLFDLSPGRSSFLLTDNAPSYNDYKRVSNN